MEGSEDRIAAGASPSHASAGGGQNGSDRVVPDRSAPSEAEVLRKRREAAHINVASDGERSTIGLALSGGGIRSATFCLGLLRGLARNRLLSEFDYLSTVSGGGYTGAMFGRLVSRVGIDRAQEILGRGDSSTLSWLRRYGRYLAPGGARDYGIGIATYLRAIVAVHLEFAMLALVLGLLPVLAHVLHLRFDLFAPDAWMHWKSVMWPFAAGFWLLFAPGLLGSYWMLRDPPPQAAKNRASSRVWMLLDALVVIAATLAGAALIAGWRLSFSLALPGPSWSLLAGLVLLSLGVCGLSMLLHRVRRGSDAVVVAEARRRLTVGLRGVNVATLALVLLGAIDWLSWELNIALRESPAGLFGGLGFGGLLLLGLRTLSEPLQKWMQPSDGRKFNALPMLINVLGFGLAFALVVLWTTLAQWLVFDSGLSMHCPAQAPGWSCAAFAAVADAGALGRWAVAAACLLVWFACTGANAESVNVSSLHNMYGARLVRAYLGAVNPHRFGGGLAADAARISPEAMSDVTEMDVDDDIAMDRYDPAAKGGPIHLINVCLNQTRGHQTRLYNADRKGVPLVVCAHGLEAGGVPVEHLPVQRVGGLGRWVAISGAAASPGAGAYTTPGWAALLFLAGVRLGFWLDAGDARLPVPGKASGQPRRRRLGDWLAGTKMGRLRAEFGAVFDGPLARHWYLSDGGHFDNTGVHALLRRELDFIVLADCGADPRYEFADIENLVRKARIDYGAEIEFYTGQAAETLLADLDRAKAKAKARTDAEAKAEAEAGTRDGKAATARAKSGEKTKTDLSKDVGADAIAKGKDAQGATRKPDRTIGFLSPETLASNFTGRGVLLARILYRPGADGQRKQGTLLVVKPNLHEALDVDVLAYARRNPKFPQQSTGDQFFDEAQWESYHRLGEDFGAHLTGDWLARIPGWSKPAERRGPDTSRIRVGRLAKDAEKKDADRPFWRINASEAAVGALSLGALLAIFGPMWQVVDKFRSERESVRQRLGARVIEAEKLFGGGSGVAEASPGRSLGFAQRLAIAELLFLSKTVDRDSAEYATAHALIARIDAACDASDGSVSAAVCEELDVQARAERRERLRYWLGAEADGARGGDGAVAAVGAGIVDARQGDAMVATLPPLPVLGPDETPPDETPPQDPPPQDPPPQDRPPQDRPLQDPPQQNRNIATSIGQSERSTTKRDVSAVLERCGKAGRSQRVYVQVYDESVRSRLQDVEWKSLRPQVIMPGIENVRITAAARDASPPAPHPVPTLLVHDNDREGACAEKLRDWLALQLKLEQKDFEIRPLPKGMSAEPGVIELWWPPQSRKASSR